MTSKHAYLYLDNDIDIEILNYNNVLIVYFKIPNMEWPESKNYKFKKT